MIELLQDEFRIYFLFWTFILGLCMGSFLNVVVLRGLTGESIVFPPSKCPKCKNQLKWWMNIPVLSYLFLRGKCFYCKEHISIQYPIVELSTALVFAAIYLFFGLSLNTVFFLIAAFLLIAMTVTDIKEKVIFDCHAYILAAAGLILNTVLFGLNGFLFSIIGAIVGFVAYEILARMGILFVGQRAFGEGDSLIALGIGAFFGWQLMLISMVLSIFIAALYEVPFYIYHCYKNGRKKSCAALSVLSAIIVIYPILGAFGVLENYAVNMTLFVLTCLVAFWTIFQIFSDLRKQDSKDKFCALPFGPAMAVSFFILMFFSGAIINYLNGIIHLIQSLL